MTNLTLIAGNAVQKPEFLQPNISAGRPIVKPATKPESITGGLKIGGSGASRFGQHGQFAADTQGEDSNQGMFYRNKKSSNFYFSCSISSSSNNHLSMNRMHQLTLLMYCYKISKHFLS